LIFANVSPADILLKEDLEAWKKKYPDRFEPIFVVAKATKDWSGMSKESNPRSLGETFN
jgi:cytochrome-b5 reductase